MADAAIDEPGGYRSLRADAAWAELPSRSVVLATGRDAIAFVDRFTTASLAAIPAGGGTETMFADARGWVLALATALKTENGLELDCGPAPRASLLDHLEHYHIREQLQLSDASAAVATFLVAGPAAADWIAARLGAAPRGPCDHVTAAAAPGELRVVRSAGFGGEAFLLRSAADAGAAVRGWFTAEGLASATHAAVETVRIEERWPLPADIPDKTLPQELDLPARAISFTKGCYLGQETVARLDALGHVNRRLTLLGCEGDPPPGATVLVDGEPAGTITSSCRSPRHAATIAMGILHRRALAPAASLAVAGRRAWLLNAPAHDSTATREQP